MARDLAQNGSVTHEFPLLTNLFDKGFTWDAFITPGYHIVTATGATAPNFAFGFPLLLAITARAFGEGALYWATPFMGALSLVVTFLLADELFRDLPPDKRHWIGALGALLLAATPKQIELSLVTMSDVPTQLFCLLAMWCALRARAERSPKPVTSRTWSALCGLLLGGAYLIRPSAMALVVPLAVVVTQWGTNRRARLTPVMIALAAFAPAILLDAIYHIRVLGSLLAVPSPESAQVVWLDAPRQVLLMLAALFSITGIGPILFCVPVGWLALTRDKNQFAAALLAAWIFAFILFHAPLFLTGVFENNLRYLIPAYPALVLSASAGVLFLSERAWNGVRDSKAQVLPRIAFTAAALFMLVALGLALRALVSPERFAARAYGWLGAQAVQEFKALNTALPANAIIGVPDQIAGTTVLYAQREIFRPANLPGPEREFPQLVQRMKTEQRPLYILGDWNCAPTANSSERLPAWLAEYAKPESSIEIHTLPFGCAFPLRELQ